MVNVSAVVCPLLKQYRENETQFKISAVRGSFHSKKLNFVHTSTPLKLILFMIVGNSLINRLWCDFLRSSQLQ